MSIASYNQQFLGFLRLTEADEIDWMDPQLLESVSNELEAWVGLPFEQWVHHAFLQVNDLTPQKSEGPVVKILAAGKPEDEPAFIFTWLPAPGQHWVQVCRVAAAISPTMPPNVAKVYGQTDEVCLQHFWNQLLSWMIPGFLHDANNHMSALTSLAQCLSGAMQDGAAWDEDQKEDLESLLYCSKETTRLFQFLSKVYKWNSNHENYYDLKDLFNDTAQLIDIALPSSFSIKTDCEESDMPVFLDPVHIAQLLLGQFSVWFPDRNQRPQGTLSLSAISSNHLPEGYGRLIGERPSRPCWLIQIRLDDSLAQKRVRDSESEFISRIQPLLLSKLQGAFLTHQLESKWILELPQAPA